ncbi:MAG: 7-cyano-7-deazaguanine synthase [Methylophilaceae bacterium]
MDNAYVLVSGGLDSAACIHFLKKQNLNVIGIHVSYGQLAQKSEYLAAQKLCEYFSCSLKLVKTSLGKKFLDGDVQGRNAYLLMSALLIADKDSLIALGIHAGTNYYDCSPIFFEKISSLVEDYSSGKIKLVAPFLEWSKGDIYRYFLDNELPLELTYSCEIGKSSPCGRCKSCLDREALNVTS